MLITIEFVFFNIITYLLMNSDYGLGCVYSPLGLVIFVALERTLVCFIITLNCYKGINDVTLIQVGRTSGHF